MCAMEELNSKIEEAIPALSLSEARLSLNSELPFLPPPCLGSNVRLRKHE